MLPIGWAERGPRPHTALQLSTSRPYGKPQAVRPRVGVNISIQYKWLSIATWVVQCRRKEPLLPAGLVATFRSKRWARSLTDSRSNGCIACCSWPRGPKARRCAGGAVQSAHSLQGGAQQHRRQLQRYISQCSTQPRPARHSLHCRHDRPRAWVRRCPCKAPAGPAGPLQGNWLSRWSVVERSSSLGRRSFQPEHS